eukprot:m.129389 g.129389  ORF g.129389 m.129389 type:complete len:187 (+) comp15849_c1_seq2:1077-1637(+)
MCACSLKRRWLHPRLSRESKSSTLKISSSSAFESNGDSVGTIAGTILEVLEDRDRLKRRRRPGLVEMDIVLLVGVPGEPSVRFLRQVWIPSFGVKRLLGVGELEADGDRGVRPSAVALTLGVVGCDELEELRGPLSLALRRDDLRQSWLKAYNRSYKAKVRGVCGRLIATCVRNDLESHSDAWCVV